ncbi:LCP family protein [Georgenia wangjunii]|uniref:LCP family protein n=1 Tax=Georgenia wangjunii TaxID=3117730 RepID=UPI002F25F4A8
MPSRPRPVPRHARSQRGRSRLGRGAALTSVAVLAFVGTGGALAYNDIQGNIDRHDITDLRGERPSAHATPPPPIDSRSGEPINLLVMGSDSREGEVNAEIGGELAETGGMRSDTTMIMHISAQRDRIDIVSIPRDTLVPIPTCRLPDGTTTDARSEAMFNSAFTTGGQTGDLGSAAACTIRTVQELTGVYIDDFVVVDFAGFIQVIDALGGVPMCVPEPMFDERAALDLEAGDQVLDGHQALAFARARYDVAGGDGSDISRIGRQQELVGAIAREALSKNLLTDMPALYRFLDAATSTLATGTQIGQIPTLAGLAYSLRGIDAEHITFATMPFEWAGYRVRPAADAAEMWAAMGADEPIEATLTATGEAPTEEPTATDGTIGASPTPDATTPPPPAGEPAPAETVTPVCG